MPDGIYTVEAFLYVGKTSPFSFLRFLIPLFQGHLWLRNTGIIFNQGAFWYYSHSFPFKSLTKVPTKFGNSKFSSKFPNNNGRLDVSLSHKLSRFVVAFCRFLKLQCWAIFAIFFGNGPWDDYKSLRMSVCFVSYLEAVFWVALFLRYRILL